VPIHKILVFSIYMFIIQVMDFWSNNKGKDNYTFTFFILLTIIKTNTYLY